MALTITNAANAPTNPKLSQTGATNDNRLYLTVTTNNTLSPVIGGYNHPSIPERSNLNTTKGFRIKCFNALTSEGVLFNESDFETRNYFVLIHSDNDRKHHFARITEILTEDQYGDAFEFEPKLGNEIPKDTKFMIIAGDLKTNTDLIAVSYGLKQNSSSMDLANNIVVARPHFYFFNDLLDKKNQLDHNKKYLFKYDENVGQTTSTASNDDTIHFRTQQDFGNIVIDYSKFSHRITLTDKLRTIDDTITGTITTNEGLSVATDDTSYNFIYPHAQRLQADRNRASNSTPKATRYLHYDYSPTRSNLLYNVVSNETSESIAGKGGFSSTSVVDNGRIMQKKIKEFYPYRVRHNIHRGELTDFFALKASFVSKSGNVYTFDTEYDLETVLNDGDEMKLGDKIFVIEDFGSLSGNTQTITVENDSTDPYVRAENDLAFVAQATTPTSGEVLHRRAYNSKDNTLMLDISLLNGRFSKMYVSFSSLNHTERFASITACDATKNMITLSFSDDSYTGAPLDYIKGEYRIFIERFNGEIENIETKKENGQTMMNIQGRDKFNKLLSPVVNLNTLFSEDIIYSTNSPHNKLSQIDSTNFTLALGATSLATGVNGANFDILPVAGNRLFTVNGYIGEVSAVSAGDPKTITLTSGALTKVDSEKIYVHSEKNYILNKALSSSHLTTTKPSSLLGAANKGLIFTSGYELNGANETNPLTGTSISSEQNALGYPINSPSSISEDNPFQCKLKDEGDTNTEATFDTINTLIDFEIVSTVSKENETQIELAPYLPITLGRKMDEFSINGQNITLTDTGAELRDISGIMADSRMLECDNIGIRAFNIGDPVYVGSTTDSAIFVGFVRNMRIQAGVAAATSYIIALDREYNHGLSPAQLTTASLNLYTATKKTHDLFLTNGAHLWGGKFLTLPHSKNTSTGPVPLNIEDIHGGADTTASYGQPIYKISNLSIGNFNLQRNRYRGKEDKLIYDNSSQLSYHALSYKIKPNTASENIVNYDTQDHMDFGLRGIENANGSVVKGGGRVAKDTNVYPNDFGSTSIFVQGNIYSSFSQINTPAFTLFMYINSDLLPYSSLREDSIMNGTKTIKNYNLFLIDNNKASDGQLNYSDVSAGKKKALTDNSFQTISFTTTESVSNLKRFGLMRLTELCLDAHFNPFNPEKKTVENSAYVNNNVALKMYEPTATNGVLGGFDYGDGSSAQLQDSDKITVVTAPSGASINNGDVIYDKHLNLIGTVSSQTSTSPSYIITLTGDKYLNHDAGLTGGTIYKLTENLGEFRGTKDKNTFMNEDRVHLQKGALITSIYQSLSSDKFNTLTGTAITFNPDDNVVSPIRISTTNTLSTINDNVFPTIPLEKIFHNNNNIYTQLCGVVLGTYNIEEGNAQSVEVGTTIPFSGANLEINRGSISPYIYAFYLSMMGHDSSDSSKFENFEYKDSDLTANTLATTPDYEATGIRLGLKPRLYYVAADNTFDFNGDGSATNFDTIKSSNGDVYRYVIDTSDSSQHMWLSLVDLTGCYLASEDGFDTILKSAVSVSTNNKEFTGSRTMDGVIPETLIYVLSHEIDSSGNHNLILDTTLTNNKAYRVLKPNETTFYDTTPKDITLNMLSSTYTKMPDLDKMYSVNQDIDILQGTRGRTSTEDGPRREAFLSMYVAVDIDKQSSSDDYLVLRKAKNFKEVLPEGVYNLYVSDGDVAYSSSIGVERGKDFTSEEEVILTFSNIEKQKGIVNITETFTVNSREEIKIDANRACIGTTVNIGLEGEDLINELMENEGIVFETTTTGSPHFLAPNYQGVDLYSAIRFITERKQMKFVEENDVFKISPERFGDNMTNIVIDDSGDFSIFEFEKITTLFDFYNEIIVYGNSHKSVRKDIKSIQKRGRKTLEVIDTTLLTQQETDSEATKLIQLHSKMNQKLSFVMDSKGISQLRVGDIVAVEIERENIPMAQYIVLEMNHRLDGLIRLELGRYAKGLEDVFSELFVSNKQTKTSLRSKELQTNELAFNFLESFKVKDLRLLIRTRTASGGFKFGFSTAFNTATTAFNVGSITFTTLLDEDLA